MISMNYSTHLSMVVFYWHGKSSKFTITFNDSYLRQWYPQKRESHVKGLSPPHHTHAPRHNHWTILKTILTLGSNWREKRLALKDTHFRTSIQLSRYDFRSSIIRGPTTSAKEFSINHNIWQTCKVSMNSSWNCIFSQLYKFPLWCIY